MPFSSIDKPSKYFDTKLYTGNGSSQSIGGLSFSPDFVWVKDRTSANSHNLSDIVRGATKTLFTDATNAEVTGATRLTSFNSDGFSVGSSGSWNTNTNNYVSWNWDANGAGVSNTSGSITSTVSANTTSGFSIVSYTGNGSTSATVGHGLGVIPAMIIIKNRSDVSQWLVKHKSLATDYNLQLNVTDAQVYLPSGTGQGGVGNLSSSSTFGFTSGTTGVNNVNNSGSNFIAYCFADVKGFSKFGSYTGNGSTDGTFSYTGFRPAFLMLKRTDTTGSWQMYDNKRDTYNPEISRLGANLSSEESTSASIYIDFLSNGFKMRNSTADWNASGGTYIYMCFAEQPFSSSKGIVANAR